MVPCAVGTCMEAALSASARGRGAFRLCEGVRSAESAPEIRRSTVFSSRFSPIRGPRSHTARSPSTPVPVPARTSVRFRLRRSASMRLHAGFVRRFASPSVGAASRRFLLLTVRSVPVTVVPGFAPPRGACSSHSGAADVTVVSKLMRLLEHRRRRSRGGASGLHPS